MAQRRDVRRGAPGPGGRRPRRQPGGGRGLAPGAARRSYLTALHRAQAPRSLEGVLRVAEDFAALGDAAAVQSCMVMAGRRRFEEPGASAGLHPALKRGRRNPL